MVAHRYPDFYKFNKQTKYNYIRNHLEMTIVSYDNRKKNK
jgi:hypothetical protein